jgi:MFS family permease
LPAPIDVDGPQVVKPAPKSDNLKTDQNPQSGVPAAIPVKKSGFRFPRLHVRNPLQWEAGIPAPTRKNMRSFVFAGVMAAGQSGITLTYLTVYLLALGATSSQIGIMTSLAGLAATLLLIPGAMLAERSGKRKLVFLLGGGGFTRLAFLPMALIPFFVPPQVAVLLIITLQILASGVSNFSTPAWTSLVGDIIPIAVRGRYFGMRTFFLNISTISTTYLFGVLISYFTSGYFGTHPVAGYQIAFGSAFVLAMLSTIFFAQIKEPDSPANLPRHGGVYHLRSWLESLSNDRLFRNYTIFGSIWNLALGVSAPYFLVYLVQGIHATPNEVGIFTIASGISALPALNLFGRLVDRWGEHRVQLITGLLIPFVPLAWTLVRIPLDATLINIPSGIIWAGFNLASFNFLLSLAPSEKRARYSALYQVAVALSSALGTLLGSLVVSLWGYIPVFVISGIGRFIGIAFLAKFVKTRR